MGENGEKQFMRLFVICELFLWRYVEIIGLKVPGNYCDQFWFNKILVLLCEGPKPLISVISVFLTPGGPLFMELNILKYFHKYEKHMETLFKNILCVGNLNF